MQAEEHRDAPSSTELLRQLLVETIASGVVREDHLERALESRDVIGQAKGILMERERVSAETAFEMLSGSSQHMNVKLRDVAALLVASVEQKAIQ